MDMQTLHPGSEVGATRRPVLPELETEQARVYAQEVRSLRQRVAVLEAELAAAKAAKKLSKTPPLTSIDFAPPAAPADKPAPVLSHMVVSSGEPTSVFTEQNAPAVIAVVPKQATPVAESAAPTTAAADPWPEATPPAPPAAPESNPGFAEAWSKEPEATFAEQVAEKAFFNATSVDEESRSWLLDS